MKALILVGGKGTRLKPYTTVIPKPLLPVGDRPILEIILLQLKNYGIIDVILAVGHMAHLFEAFFQDGRRLGMNITYSFEDKVLGTAGPIANVLDRLGEDFIVMNGDLLTTLNYKKLYNLHCEKRAAGTIAIFRREIKMSFGVIETNSQEMLESYTEKPTFSFDFGMGVNVINSKAVSGLLTKGEYMDLPDLMVQLKTNGHPVHCYREDGFWLDMGSPEDYDQANIVFEKRKNEFLPSSAK
ncbi:sugar phosphate nucleotidyltransferase [bacterium]|nr:sugar phosphate nucleotidyltransferase [bacterium]